MDFDKVRKNMENVIRIIIQTEIRLANEPADNDLIAAAASALEQRIYEYTIASSSSASAFPAYMRSASIAQMILKTKGDLFLARSIAVLLGTGDPDAPSPDKIVVDDEREKMMDELASPRRIYLGVFYKSLSENESTQEHAKLWAVKIERSCNNAVVRYCMATNQPCKWTAPEFQTAYSERCGAVNCHINIKSHVCKIHGSHTLDMLLSGEWSPEDIGEKSEYEMCPRATEAERQMLELRSKQAIEYRTTKVYCCPRCKCMESTYRTVQLRSSDEGTSVLCKCINCGFEYKGH